nr:hypothetical protein [Streptomyces sp. TLI_235]
MPTIQTISGPHRLLQVDTGRVLDTEIDPDQWRRGVNFCYAVASGLAGVQF